MILDLLIFAIAFYLVIRGATLSTRYATKIAESFRWSKYTVGFVVVAIISILPETFISINAALQGVPELGLGTLFGSNVADLTLVIAFIIYLTHRSLKIESKILGIHVIYPLLLLLPLILGIDGAYTRIEGAALIVLGFIFYYIALKNGREGTTEIIETAGRSRNIGILLFGMILLLIGAHFTVESASNLAVYFDVSPVLIGILIVGLGTTLPEFFFSLRSARQLEDSMAIGDILGTVLADATIVVGILALIAPFTFPPKIIYITGFFMVLASVLLFYFMRTGRAVTRNEAAQLTLLWAIFVIVEFIANAN